MSGSAARTRTPTGCCASTFQRAPTSARTAPRTLQPWRWPSTAGRERRSAGEHLPRLWTSSSNPVTQAVLRQPLESTLFSSIASTIADIGAVGERDRLTEVTSARIAQLSTREREVLEGLLGGG